MKHLYFLTFIFLPLCIQAQQERFVITGSKTCVRIATYDLIQSLENEDPDPIIAIKYHQLAKELVRQGEFAKAETYYNDASRLYIKVGNQEQLNKLLKEVSDLREAQRKWGSVYKGREIYANLPVKQSYASSAAITTSYLEPHLIAPDTTQMKEVLLVKATPPIQVTKPKATSSKEILNVSLPVSETNNILQADSCFFEAQEKRIAQLEKERTLKDELIRKKDQANQILQVALLLILICFFFIIRAWVAIRRKNKQIALQSLSREMNPHFLFNSLNSVNQFIAENDELKANKYLTSYSRLMRNILENSNKDFISLASELEQLKEYLDLEQLRFHSKFTYVIDVDDNLDPESVYIPNMLIQPYLENAIWHGLRYKEGMGTLVLTIRRDSAGINFRIEDDGIGIVKSQQLKTQNQMKHHSRGLANTKERIRLLNSLYRIHITTDVSDKKENGTGVIVCLHYQFQHKTLWKKHIGLKA